MTSSSVQVRIGGEDEGACSVAYTAEEKAIARMRMKTKVVIVPAIVVVSEISLLRD